MRVEELTSEEDEIIQSFDLVSFWLFAVENL